MKFDAVVSEINNYFIKVEKTFLYYKNIVFIMYNWGNLLSDS